MYFPRRNRWICTKVKKWMSSIEYVENVERQMSPVSCVDVGWFDKYSLLRYRVHRVCWMFVFKN